MACFRWPCKPRSTSESSRRGGRTPPPAFGSICLHKRLRWTTRAARRRSSRISTSILSPRSASCTASTSSGISLRASRTSNVMNPRTPDASPDETVVPVLVYDTTLRDGTQREGVSLSAVDKIRIARLLDRLGVAFLELGWPGSNPKDEEVFARARDVQWTTASIAAFGSTRRAGVSPGDDAQVISLLETGAPVCTIFGKASILHVRDVLSISAEENLRMISETVGFLVENGRRVIYDAEHFFDGYREDAEFAMETLWAAAKGGAETIVLCDTNGGSLPWDVEQRIRTVAAAIGCPIGIHSHDDAGCGVANAIAAVRGGATHVQGTINGYGERCGNANLCSIVPNLELKMGR